MGKQSLAVLRGLADAFAAEWAAALREPDRERHTVIAASAEQFDAQLAVLESRTRRSLVNMQSRWYVDPFQRHSPLNEKSRARGVSLTLIVPQRAIDLSPLLPSLHPDLWIAPVHQDAMLIDSTLAVLSGGFADTGERLYCTTTDATLVRLLSEIEIALREVAVRPQEITGQAPLTERQVEVAFAVARGDKDTTTARRLGTSLRTVEREVSAVLRHLGVRTRQEAALALLGERN